MENSASSEAVNLQTNVSLHQAENQRCPENSKLKLQLSPVSLELVTVKCEFNEYAILEYCEATPSNKNQVKLKGKFSSGTEV